MLPRTALVLVAHPDDEIMCAGTIKKLQANGCLVEAVASCRPDKNEYNRLIEWHNAMSVLGIEHHRLMDQREGDFAWTMDNIGMVEDWVDNRPHFYDVIISHRLSDTQQHHVYMAGIAKSLARKNNISLWEMEQAMPGGVDPDAPAPNFFVDVSEYWPVKLDLIDCYPSQERKYPGWYRALTARGEAWGWMTNHNHGEPRLVEAFRIQKQVWL